MSGLHLPFIAADVPGAAAACGCSEGTIRLAIRQGDLIPRYLGARSTKPVLLATDLVEWLEGRPTDKGGPKR